MWTVPGMTKSRTWWPFSITGRFSTEPARSSGRAVNCWSGTGTSTARSWASNGAASGSKSSGQGQVGSAVLLQNGKKRRGSWKCSWSNYNPVQLHCTIQSNISKVSNQLLQKWRIHFIHIWLLGTIFIFFIFVLIFLSPSCISDWNPFTVNETWPSVLSNLSPTARRRSGPIGVLNQMPFRMGGSDSALLRCYL